MKPKLLSGKQIQAVLEDCAVRRGVKDLEWRTMREFGNFIIEMESFIVFGEISREDAIRKFQLALKRRRRRLTGTDAATFTTYVRLFHDFWKADPYPVRMHDDLKLLRRQIRAAAARAPARGSKRTGPGPTR